MRSSRGSRAESVAGSQHRRRLPKALLAISMLILVAALLFAVAAPAMATGTISGTVRDSATAVPMTDVVVTAYEYVGGVWISRDSDTTASGAYELTVDEGTYSVSFVSTGYVTQWWDNEASLLMSDDVAVVDGEDTINIDASLVAAPNTTTVTAPTGTGTYAPGSSVTVTWTSARHYAIDDTFKVWMRDSDGVFRGMQTYTVASATDTSFTMSYPVPSFPGTGNQIVVAAVSGSDLTNWGTSPGSFTVSGATAQAITVTAPTGTGSYAAGDELTVKWTMSQAPAAGTFDVYVRSASGSSWFLFDQFTASTSVTSYTSTHTLASAGVPAGTGYQAIVRYAYTARRISSAHGATAYLFGTSPGTFTVTGASTFTTAVTAPTGTSGSYLQSSTVLVNWNTSAPVPAGKFIVWARSSAGVFYVAQEVPITAGQQGFTWNLSLATVPVGTGYSVVTGFVPTGGAVTSWGTSPGTFAVTGAASTVTITAPTATASYAYGDHVTVTWTTGIAAPTGAQYGVWLRIGGVWSNYTLNTEASGSKTSYSQLLTGVVPSTLGSYQAVVGYRLTSTSDWTFTTSASFPVVAVSTIDVQSPFSGTEGSDVTLTGTGFSDVTAVHFHDYAGTYTAVGTSLIKTSGTSITFTVPATAVTGSIEVNTTGNIVLSTSYGVAPKFATVLPFTPTFGLVGATVTINGSGFTNGTTTVTFFNGQAGTVTAVSAISMTVVVPAGATTGQLILSNAGGTVISEGSFSVVPAITGAFNPIAATGAAVGVTLTVNGTGFSGATVVTFTQGGSTGPALVVAAPVVSVTGTTSLTCVVPTGLSPTSGTATTHTVTVTTPGGTSAAVAYKII